MYGNNVKFPLNPNARSMKTIMPFVCCLLMATLCSSTSSRPVKYYVARYENVLGTSLEVKVLTASSAVSEKARAAVLREIARLSAILSGYDPHSEFSQWMRTSNVPQRVSPELFEVLGLFDSWRVRTDGALDASAEIVTRLWKQAAARGQIPTDPELQQAVARVRQLHWRLDSVNRTATHLSDAPLMLNSFAKSYIIRRAAEAGRAVGHVDGIVVNIGGDMIILGEVNERVLISDPKDDAENAAAIDRLMVSNRAVATSGNYRRGEQIAGRWYSHIVDPRTGQPAGAVISATVVAPGATDAGALATAFNVLSPAESAALAAKIPGVEYLIITASGERIMSHGWKSLEWETPTGLPIADKEETEMVINLQINLQDGGNVKRPYVAVWVEDENHAPVRTITVWHGSDRYMDELKSWYLKYHELYTTDGNFGSSSTSATRSAGKYTLKWDGKDDVGKPVKPGKYFLKIEAAREHGTHQLLRQEFDWANTVTQINIGANIEVSASMEIRKTGNGN